MRRDLQTKSFLSPLLTLETKKLYDLHKNLPRQVNNFYFYCISLLWISVELLWLLLSSSGSPLRRRPGHYYAALFHCIGPVSMSPAPSVRGRHR